MTVQNDGVDAQIAQLVTATAGRRRKSAHVIVFANEKGGVGKSTLAFHCAVALANAGADVLAIDLDARQRSFSTALENREGTNTCLNAHLRCPRYCVIDKQSSAVLLQEMARLGSSARFILIDTPGADTPAARCAIALADTLVTPVNASFVDLQQLARFSPVSNALKAVGPFGGLVEAVQRERQRQSRPVADWVLLKNRVRSSELRQQERVDDALNRLGQYFGARIASGLAERVIYRELFVFGLTSPDIQAIPQLGQRKVADAREIERMLAELRLPPMGLVSSKALVGNAHVAARTRDNYLQALRTHIDPQRAASRR